MMDFRGNELKDGFEKAFGVSLNTLTVDQMRWLVNVAKHVRGRCRSNAALVNYLNQSFPHLRFVQEERTGRDGRSYEVTAIVPK